MRIGRRDVALRGEAEARVSYKRAPGEPGSEGEAQRLLHELEVHRIELEMQHEELQRAQVELQESRDRCWDLYDQAPIGYLTLDADGKIVEANLRAAAMLGMERGQVIGLPLGTFMNADDAQVFHRHRRDVFLHETKQGCDVWIRRLGGAAFAAHLDSVARVAPEGPRGVPARCHTILLDLSELRRTQDALRSQESRTQTLLDTAADAIVSTDEQGRIESMNAAAERLFDYQEAELRGRSVQVLMPAPPREEPGRDIGLPSRETIGVRKDGTVRPLDITVGEWWDRGVRKLTAIVRDISARKQSERQLQESELRFRQIAEHIEDVFYVRESTGVLSYVSPAYERIWRREARELAGNPAAWLETIDVEDRARIAEAWARMRDGEPISEVYRIWRPDGTMRWVLSRGFPVFGTQREVVRSVGIVRDITTERKLEEDLRQSLKMEAVGTLAGGMAHNLRNVLQAVLAFIHIAQRAGAKNERAVQALERAAKTAKRGASLTDQLMTFSRKQEPNLRLVSLDATVHEAAELLKPMVGDQVVVEIDCRAPDAVILADPVLVEQILLNLSANARDAMPNGGILSITTEELVFEEQTAQARGVAKGLHVKVVIRDNGTGMSPETMARVFEPFFTTKEVGKGTGLGLATVFALTRQAHGCIEVDSQLGSGTAFTICFPSLRGTTGSSLPPLT